MLDCLQAQELQGLKAFLGHITEALDALVVPDAGLTKEGVWAVDFLEQAGKGFLHFGSKDTVLDLLDRAISSLTTASDPSQQSETLCLQKIAETIGRVFQASSRSEAMQNNKYYKVHVHTDPNMQAPRRNFDDFAPIRRTKQHGKRIFSFWCFNPGIAMSSLINEHGIHCAVMTSGTLAPLQSFASDFQTDFAVTLENPHVIGPEQLFVGVLTKGPTNQCLNSSYRTRSNPAYVKDVGNAVVMFSRMFRGGLLVFFPSYSVMNTNLEAWGLRSDSGVPAKGTVMERISQNKHIVVEPRRSAELKEAMETYYEQVRVSRATGSGGAVFFAVCRGKVSEGLDFADDNGRAVVVTGIPYAAAKDAKVLLKRAYQDRAAADARGSRFAPVNGEQWYKQQAIRAVNQAIGRVIRHKDDYGAILLCDERFTGQLHQLSKWLRPHAKVFRRYGEAYGALIKFFKSKPDNRRENNQPAAAAAAAAVPRRPPAQDPRAALPIPARQPPKQTASLLEIIDRKPKPAMRQFAAAPKVGRGHVAISATAATPTPKPLPKQPTLIYRLKGLMAPAAFNQLRALVTRLSNKTLPAPQFCSQVIQLLQGMACDRATQRELMQQLESVLRPQASGRFHILCGRFDWDLPTCCVFLS
jgi:regulator of telomere elongation helicase 1